MKIAIIDEMPLSVEFFKSLKSLGELKIYKSSPQNEDETTERMKNADMVITKWTSINSKMIDSSPNLKFIICASAGYGGIDTKHAARKGIVVLNCPLHNSYTVASFTMGLILSLTRRVKEADSSIQKGRWIRGSFEGIELEGRTLGVIGYGNIGKRVASIARLLGMMVLHANSKSKQGDIDKIIKRSDVVSLHMSLNESTLGIIDKRRIGMMKKGAYIINVSRGKLIDQKALLFALKSKRIAGAGLDVFANEPGKAYNGKLPEEIAALARMDNVIATPHMAFNTRESYERLGAELISCIKSCINGKPVNVVS